MSTCVSAYAKGVCVCVCVYVCTCVCAHVYVWVYMFVYICPSVCVYVCVRVCVRVACVIQYVCLTGELICVYGQYLLSLPVVWLSIFLSVNHLIF